jgi:hypothetical protein
MIAGNLFLREDKESGHKVREILTFMPGYHLLRRMLGSTRSMETRRSPKLYFFIDHWEGERYVEFGTKTHIPEHGSRWSALQYRVARNSKQASPLDDL